MLATGLSGLTGGLYDFHRFFDNFGPDCFHATSEQLGGIGLFAGLRGPIRDRPFQFVDRSCTGAHALPCFPVETAG